MVWEKQSRGTGRGPGKERERIKKPGLMRQETGSEEKNIFFLQAERDGNMI